jgi:DNA adenine methylase
MSLRDIIRGAAEKRNLDYKAVAEKSGLPRATVHRYLNGKLDLTGGRIDLLLGALGLEPGPVRQKRLRAKPEPLFLSVAAGAKPLFSYPGSKWDAMAEIIPQMPPHHHYVSVFGGSGSDIIRKTPSKLETFNDLDGQVHNVFAVLQDKRQQKALKNRLAATPSQSHVVFQQAIAGLASADPVDRAWAFLVISYQSFCVQSPSMAVPVRWRFVKYPITTPRRWLTLPQTVEEVAARFRSVQLTQWDWRMVVRRTDSARTLFFVDPPYLGTTNFECSLSDADHEELLHKLLRIKGFAIVCGHPNSLYDSALKGWRRQALGQTRSKAAEIVWMNFDAAGVKLK